MKILIFTEGTILLHPSARRLTREEKVQWSKDLKRPLPVGFFENHVPNGDAAQKIQKWKNQGAKIFYLTSRTTRKQVGDIKKVLEKYNFPDCQNLLYRKEDEQYKNVAEKLVPDIIIEDDCESIGGEVEMTYPHIKEDLKRKIKSIVVKEFAGIDPLPDRCEELKVYDNN